MYVPKYTPRSQGAGTDGGIEQGKVLRGIAVLKSEFGATQRPRVTVPRGQTVSHKLPRRGFEVLAVGTEEAWIGPKGNKEVLEGDSILGQKPHIPEVVASLGSKLLVAM